VNVVVSAWSFSSQNVAPLLVNPQNLPRTISQAWLLDLHEIPKEYELGLKYMIPDQEAFAKFCGEHPRCEKYIVAAS